jgi:hypothetical protein
MTVMSEAHDDCLVCGVLNGRDAHDCLDECECLPPDVCDAHDIRGICHANDGIDDCGVCDVHDCLDECECLPPDVYDGRDIGHANDGFDDCDAHDCLNECECSPPDVYDAHDIGHANDGFGDCDACLLCRHVHGGHDGCVIRGVCHGHDDCL